MSRKIPTGSVKGRRIEFQDTKEDEDSKEGKYLIRMYKKHTSATFADAMQIVENNKHWYDKDFLYVTFDEPNEDLMNLFSIAKAWKVFKFFIDDEEIKKNNFNFIFNTLYCEHKDYCEGICYQDVRILYKGHRIWCTQQGIISNLLEIDSKDYWEIVNSLGNKPWVVEKEKENDTIYTINKIVLEEQLMKNYKIVEKYCNLYDVNKLGSMIKKIKKTYKRSEFDKSSHVHSFIRTAYSVEDNEKEIPQNSINYVYLTDDQINQLAKKIGEEIGKVLKKILKK